MGSSPPPVDDCDQCEATQVPVHFLDLHFQLHVTAKKPLQITVAVCYQCMMDLGIWEEPATEDQGPIQ